MQKMESDWGNLGDEERIWIFICLFEDTFSVDWLIELSNVKATTILEVLDKKIRDGLIEYLSPGFYRILPNNNHENLQNYMTPHTEETLHKKIIDIILKDNLNKQDQLIFISKHLLKVSSDLFIGKKLLEAGNVYRNKGEWDESRKYYLKAISELRNISDDNAVKLFIEGVIEYAKDFNITRDPENIMNFLNDAITFARRFNDKNKLAILEMIIANIKWIKNEYDTAIDHYRRASHIANSLKDKNVQRTLFKANCFYYYWSGRFGELIEIYEKNSSNLQDHYSFDPRSLQFGIIVGISYALTGHVSQGIGMVNEILKHCKKIGQHGTSSMAGTALGLIFLNISRFDDAIDVLIESLNDENQRITFSKFWINYYLSYIYYRINDYSLSVNYLKESLHIGKCLGCNIRYHPYLLELCWAMEYEGYPRQKGMSLTTELDQSLKAKSLLVRGVAYRYQALLYKKNGSPFINIYEYLDKSFELLKKSGHKIEFSTTAVELSKLYYHNNDFVYAKKFIQIAAEDSNTVAVLPDELLALLGDYKPRDDFLKQIMARANEIISMRESDEVLRHLVSTVNKITGAERGAIFLVNNNCKIDSNSMICSINLPLNSITDPDFASSLTSVKYTIENGKSLVKKFDISDNCSVTTNKNIKSVLCIPLVLKSKIIGVLYHDNRIYSSAFNEIDLTSLTYFASLAAVALDNAKAYEEIKQLNRRLREETEYYRDHRFINANFEDFIGVSSSLIQVLEDVERVAKTDTNVLILGETGVGKEMVAQAIHRHSTRSNKPFILAQCSNFSENLITSELFGHESGSYTGAKGRRIGRFELANEGTIFLDEIGDVPLDVQVRLLRILQTHQFERVGGNQTIHSDFRLIAATNRDLDHMVNNSEFRADLYYRLNVFPILVPPLRNRKEDIPLLANHFIGYYSKKLNKSFTGISKADMNKLDNYWWPGNVRELKNVIERALILSSGPTLRIPDLVPKNINHGDFHDTLSLQDREKREIINTLQMTGWKVYGKGGAAEALGVNHNTLYSKMRKHNIKRPK